MTHRCVTCAIHGTARSSFPVSELGGPRMVLSGVPPAVQNLAAALFYRALAPDRGSDCHCRCEVPSACDALERVLRECVSVVKEPLVCPAGQSPPEEVGRFSLVVVATLLFFLGVCVGALGAAAVLRGAPSQTRLLRPTSPPSPTSSGTPVARPITPATLRSLKDGGRSASESRR